MENIWCRCPGFGSRGSAELASLRRRQGFTCAGHRWFQAVPAGFNRPNTEHSWAPQPSSCYFRAKIFKKDHNAVNSDIKNCKKWPCKHQGQKRSRRKFSKLQSSDSPMSHREDLTGAQSLISVNVGSYARGGRYFLSGIVACGKSSSSQKWCRP